MHTSVGGARTGKSGNAGRKTFVMYEGADA